MRGLIYCFLLLSATITNAQFDHWETVIKANEQWRYFPCTAESAANWRELSFNETVWPLGPGGFGFEDNDDATIISTGVPSVFFRKEFTIVDKSKIEQAILSVDYDDGFVAYLNGTEIARANMNTGTPFPTFNTYATGLADEVTVPVSFIVSESTLNTLLIEGENVLAVQVHNQSGTSSDLSSNVFFSVGIKDGSFTYQAPPDWFAAPLDFVSSNLPIIVLNTSGQGIPDDPKLKVHMGVIDNGPGNRNHLTDAFNNYDGFIGIETRGESSQMFPKKSYALETQDAAGESINVELLGFPAENDWILYAPYTDKSMVRNDITFKLSRDMGRYASRTRACEVVLNGDYQGVYILMEKIKRDDNRVDIATLDPDEISGDDLTGGYILRVDKIDGNDYPQWQSAGIDFQYYDPDGEDLASAQKSYIQSFIGSVNNSILSTSFKSETLGYRQYLDVPSFIDNMLINELGKNVDGFRFSTFMYKDKDSNGGKLVLGPLWDFNLAYGNINYNGVLEDPIGNWLYLDSRMWWFPRLMQDQRFQYELYVRWDSLRETVLSNTRIISLIDSMALAMDEAQVRNYQRWPIIGEYVWPNKDWQNETYQEEVDFVKEWIIARANWMDDNLPRGSLVTGVEDELDNRRLTIYPNPGKNLFTVEWKRPFDAGTMVNVRDIVGREVYSTVMTIPGTITWDGKSSSGNDLHPGMYIVTIKTKTNHTLTGKLIKQ